MNNDVIKTTKTVTTTGNQQYKLRDRSVSPETAQKKTQAASNPIMPPTHEARHQMVQSGARKFPHH